MTDSTAPAAALPIEPWPDPASAVGKAFFAGADECFAAWKQRGTSTTFAIGMVAQAEAESSFDPNAMGDRETSWDGKSRITTAYGLYQLHDGRIAEIKSATGVDLKALVLAQKCTIEICVGAAWWEFTHLHWTGQAAIASQKTAAGAAYQACILFERAGADGAAERRAKMAERWTPYFAKKGF